MSVSRNSTRFRINPVELVIFSIVSLVFLNSVYKLFYDWQSVKTAALTPTRPDGDSDRQPAAIKQSFTNLDIGCDQEKIDPVASAKVKLSLPICGLNAKADLAKLRTTEITNSANKATAVVFVDLNLATISTDLIPLNAGENPITVKFSYDGGKVVTRQFVIQKK
ncbi:MAG: hypothetical protein AB7P04_08445 [Bacteriovoracia bacterium]